MIRPDPITPEIAELFNYLMLYASTGNLGVISVLDTAGKTRYALMGRHPRPNGYSLVPLGFLSNTAGDEIEPQSLGHDRLHHIAEEEFVLLPERYEAFLAYQQEPLDRWADDGGAYA